MKKILYILMLTGLMACTSETVKDAKATAALSSVLNPYFDVVVSTTKEGLPTSEEDATEEEAPAEKAADDFED